MSLGKKEFIIADLVRKELLVGELSIEENALLHEWLSVPENHEYYQKIIDLETLKSKERFYNSINTDLAFDRIKEKLDFSEVPVISLFNYRKIWRFAAVLVFLVGISSVFFYLNKSRDIKNNEVVVKSDEPKFDHPTLVLEDGTIVSLEPKKEKIVSKNGIISNVNDVLVYDAKAINGKTTTGENTLIVPSGHVYAVNLSDGTKVWLNSKSSLKYPMEFSGDKRIVKLEGEAYFEVAPNVKMPFKVLSNGQEVEVLGTHFNIRAYENEPVFKTTLLEGKIKISEGSNSALVKPGQQIIISLEKHSLRSREVNTELAVAWKNRLFYFENAKYDEIMREIERWYDVDVIYKGKIPDERFEGAIQKDLKLDQVLKMLESKDVHFKVIGKEVIVTQ